MQRVAKRASRRALIPAAEGPLRKTHDGTVYGVGPHGAWSRVRSKARTKSGRRLRKRILAFARIALAWYEFQALPAPTEAQGS